VANIAALGGRPLPLGVVGDDESGRLLLAELERRGVPIEGIRVRAGYRTPTKTRILGGAKGTIKQQIVRFDVEESLTLAEGDRDHFRRQLEAWIARGEPAGVAVLSDYGYGTVETPLVGELRRALAGGGGTLVCDSRYRLAEFHGVDAATPNEEEAELLYGGDLEGSQGGRAALHRAGTELMERLGVRFLLVTRGSRGLSLFLPGRSAHLPVHGTAQVADVTGAGDTVIGTFALALAAGASPLEAAALADYAGGVVVMKMGTATLSPAELADAIEGDSSPLEELRWEPS